jgi:hypothetical protein
MFIGGAIFVFAANQVDPATNCDEAGNCAPFLVYLAFGFGAIFAAFGLRLLLLNPNRGSAVDKTAGEFVWWRHRIGDTGGTQGRTNGQNIARIRIAKREESGDGLHIYDQQGERLFLFEASVVPDDVEAWARAMADYWPHIEIEIV